MQQRVYEKVLLDSVFHGIQKIQGELKKIIFNKHDEFSSVKKVEFTVKKQGLMVYSAISLLPICHRKGLTGSEILPRNIKENIREKVRRVQM